MLHRRWPNGVNRIMLSLNAVFLIIQGLALITWVHNGTISNPLSSPEEDVKPHRHMRDSPLIQNFSNQHAPHVQKIRVPLKKTWDYNWDGRHLNASSIRATRHLYLVRHGQYHKKGQMRRHLTQLGKKQADLVGKRLQSLDIKFDRYVVSTSVRAMETSEIIMNYFPYVSAERSHLLKEGRPNYPEPPLKYWDSRDKQFEVDGARLSKAYMTYIHRASPAQRHDTNELFVIHGNVIAYFTLRALQLTEEAWLRIAVYQGSVTRMDILPNGQVILKLLGDIGHISRPDWTE